MIPSDYRKNYIVEKMALGDLNSSWGCFNPKVRTCHDEFIADLVKGFKEGNKFQTLLGVTGSGKAFTMANVIEQLQKPTLIIAHNKTLAGQLYSEFKEFFPENAVEYFVSYYGTASM